MPCYVKCSGVVRNLILGCARVDNEIMYRAYFKEIAVLLATTLITADCGWGSDLPADKYTEWTTEKEIFVPMRDGVHLDTDIWLPKGMTGKLPAILVST